MMIHRVENTLLIDEFDIHKHLIQQAENNWEWLKKFFFEHILSSLNSKVHPKIGNLVIPLTFIFFFSNHSYKVTFLPYLVSYV